MFGAQLRIRGSAIVMALCGSLMPSAQAQEAYYAGKTITIISPADPGGSYDLYARLVAGHIGRHIPGQPIVIVRNMAGAGGIRALAYMASAAPRAGTFLQIPVQDIALSEVLGRASGQYKTSAFNWIGRIAPSIDLSVTWHTSKVRTIDDARRLDFTVAATGPDSPTSVNPTALNALVGTKFKVIRGYNSNAQMSAAMERGETDGAFVTWATLNTTFPSWIAERKLNWLVVYSTERLAALPDVPAVTELGTTDTTKKVLALLASTGVLGRSLMTTPEVPAEQVATLRTAFDRMTADPQFVEAVKKLRIEFEPMPGERLQKEIMSMVDAPQEILDLARNALRDPTAK